MNQTSVLAISADDSLAGPVRAMATAVSNISHAAIADDKAAMAEISVDEQVPDRAKAMAGVIASFNHTASEDDKANLTELYEL